MKISFIATVLNEEKTIDKLLTSIFYQSRIPDEVIIVDGGSTDSTLSVISNFKFQISNKKLKIKFIIKKGNRAVGRNEAIKHAKGNIIVCSDAGCILDKDWVKNISKPFIDSRFRGNDSVDRAVNVVAGYYKGQSDSVFEKCLVPYVLVMPDKVDPQNFLPASRSMAFRKSVWKKIGGFPEKFSNNEDYVFSNKLKEIKAKIVFQKSAIVNWIPRKNLKEAFIMFYRFALGDAESKIFRPKVLLLFARYLLGLYLLLLLVIMKSPVLLYGLTLGLLIYTGWSIKKNYKYVQKIQALLFLPILQLVSDIAVILGTTLGFLKIIHIQTILQIIKNNKGVGLIVGTYVILMIAVINWGIPNKNHPFNYFMDEWHQAQAVRGVFTYGSPNIEGAANGSMFHFFLTGLYLIPFVVLGIVNPFAIESSVSALDIQQRLFQILRLNTLLFGIGSIILIVYIGKKFFKLHPLLISFLFVVNPIWLTLSNYFKYDIALVFWILVSFLFFLRYSTNPTLFNFLAASFFCGISLSVKISGVPLFPLLLIAFFLFNKNWRNSIPHLIAGIIIFVGTFLLFGIPDLIFAKGDINEYLYDNLVRSPSYDKNYILGMPYWLYLLTKSPLTLFGNSLFFISFLGTIFMFILIMREKVSSKKRIYIFLLISFVLFIASLIPLKIEARGNRLLVLLPFLTLMSGIFVKNLLVNRIGLVRKIIIGIVSILLLFQAIEAFIWEYIKLPPDFRQRSSEWIKTHVAQGSTIGIENIPIYQFLPDIILKEFHTKQYYPGWNINYTYKIIDGSSASLPYYVVISNGGIAKNYLIKSPKKVLIKRLESQGYKEIFHLKQEFAMLKLFRSELDYFMSGLIQSPVSVSIYKKS